MSCRVMRSLRVAKLASAAVLVAATAAWMVAAIALDVPVAMAQEPSARSWIGISMREDKSAEQVFVRSVVRDSPAERAGVKAGDRIVWIGGRTVHTPGDVVRAVARLAPGASVQIIVERDGRRQTITARVEAMPSVESLMKRELVGKAAPAWQQLAGLEGRPAPTIESLRGRVVVVDFWASWCTACGFTTRHLNEWAAKYGARGLVVVGVAPEPADQVQAGRERHGIRYATAADPTMGTTEAYHVNELPTVVVIDRRGMVRDVATGYAPTRMAEIETLVVRLLAEAP
jgi:peroxiredoxin